MVSAELSTLVVAELYPWPPVDGYRQRLHHIVGGLTEAGTVDLVAPVRPGSPAPVAPPWEGVRRTLTEEMPAPGGPRSWLEAWTRGEEPRRILSYDWSLLVEQLSAWRDRYDLVWYSHVDAWFPTHHLFATVPSIVDFDNLENLSMRLRRRVPPRFDPADGPVDRVRAGARWATSRGFDVVDERRWDRIQRRVADEVDHVVVCSDLDVGRSGCPGVVVVPNGAEPPAVVDVDRRALRSGRPTLLFVGALDYEPNNEAMSWFLRDVWPTIHAAQPDAVVRVVGRGGDALGSLARADGVEMVGTVPDLSVELRGADVSIVPIRVGAGTRLKVIEALANHLPLVTTTVGAEGIDVADGRTALVADDTATFAGAALRLIADGALRQRLADAGRDLFERSYTWEGIRHGVADLARSTVARR